MPGPFPAKAVTQTMTGPAAAPRGRARRSPHVNMADVAALAGVSTSTVSRALRGMPGVSDSRRERIKHIAEELSYVISPEASRLSRGSTGRVAVVVPTIDHWYFSTMLAGVAAVMRDAGLDVLIYHVGGVTDRRRFFRDLPARRKADAVIVIALPVPEQEAARLELMGLQVVVAGGRMLDYPHVRIDDREVGRQAVTHLIGLGHRRIAMIRTHDGEGVLWPADLARTQGYRDALTAHGLMYDGQRVVTTQFGPRGGLEAAEQLLALPERPTAIFAHSDEVAFGALRALQLAGSDVPGSMSVVGVDDHPMAEMHDLTTVRQPVALQGRIAATMVLDLLHGRPVAEAATCLPTELVVRGSTAPLVDAAEVSRARAAAEASLPASPSASRRRRPSAPAP